MTFITSHVGGQVALESNSRCKGTGTVGTFVLKTTSQNNIFFKKIFFVENSVMVFYETCRLTINSLIIYDTLADSKIGGGRGVRGRSGSLGHHSDWSANERPESNSISLSELTIRSKSSEDSSDIAKSILIVLIRKVFIFCCSFYL